MQTQRDRQQFQVRGNGQINVQINGQGKVIASVAARLSTGLTMAMAIATLAAPTTAQVAPSSPPMFTNLRLSPSFIPDPTRLRGLSGGDLPTEQLAGRLQTETGTCLGFVSEKPDHNLELTQFFDYLNIQLFSAEDSVMLIKGPGGTWCNDNRSVPLASVAGQWLPGRYEIWVGSAAAGNYAPYSIELTEVR